MKVLVGIGHPAHVHFYKNMIWNLERKGHEIKVIARNNDIVIELLNTYGFNYEKSSAFYTMLLKKAYIMFQIDYKLYKIVKKFRPDILTGILYMYGAHVGKIIRRPSVIFTDTEHARLANRLTFPFASAICTPSCFKKDLGPKQVRYNGYHELAYLHPNYFKSDPSVLDSLGLSKDDKFIILRFVSWGASHDIGQHGLDLETKQRFVRELEKYCRIFITSEAEPGKEFENYKIRVPPEKIHDLLYYATMYIGEGATMATEAGILGTPSIYISSLVGTMGNFDELDKKYGLVYSFTDPNKALEKAISLIENKNLKNEWQTKREKLLKDKIDVTKWMTEFIENYPESFDELKI